MNIQLYTGIIVSCSSFRMSFVYTRYLSTKDDFDFYDESLMSFVYTRYLSPTCCENFLQNTSIDLCIL